MPGSAAEYAPTHVDIHVHTLALQTPQHKHPHDRCIRSVHVLEVVDQRDYADLTEAWHYSSHSSLEIGSLVDFVTVIIKCNKGTENGNEFRPGVRPVFLGVVHAFTYNIVYCGDLEVGDLCLIVLVR